MLSKKLAAVDQTRCVACGVCENTCPLGAVKVSGAATPLWRRNAALAAASAQGSVPWAASR